jgi:hypothetical protein
LGNWSILSEGEIEEYYRYGLIPNAIELTEISENLIMSLYLTFEDDDHFILYNEITYIDFRVSLFDYVSIGTNCGSVIRANDQIVVVSCPDYKNAPLSVYTTNLVHLKTIEGTANKQIFTFLFQINLTFNRCLQNCDPNRNCQLSFTCMQ